MTPDFSYRSSLYDVLSDDEEEERGGRRGEELGRGVLGVGEDLMVHLDSIIPGVLEPIGGCCVIKSLVHRASVHPPPAPQPRLPPVQRTLPPNPLLTPSKKPW